MVVRWIGAFGKSSSLSNSLSWELTQNEREVAAEYINGNQGSIRHAKVGLLLAKGSVIRSFPGDVWSVAKNGKLEPTRQATGWCKNHTECFCRPEYSAIVLKERPERLTKTVVDAIKKASIEYNLPVYVLRRNGKKEVVAM